MEKGHVYVWVSSNDLVIDVLAESSGSVGASEQSEEEGIDAMEYIQHENPNHRKMNDTSRTTLLLLLWQCHS